MRKKKNDRGMGRLLELFKDLHYFEPIKGFLAQKGMWLLMIVEDGETELEVILMKNGKPSFTQHVSKFVEDIYYSDFLECFVDQLNSLSPEEEGSVIEVMDGDKHASTSTETKLLNSFCFDSLIHFWTRRNKC